MLSLTEFFNTPEDITSRHHGIVRKNNLIKRSIITYMAAHEGSALSELTKELHVSVPTITKLVQELVDDNIVIDLGKVETPGGRRPNVFGLANSAIYFVGVHVGRDNMSFLVTDLQNNIIKQEFDTTFELLDRPQCLEHICTNIENFIINCGIDRNKILGVGIGMTGRVNPDTGRSYKYFTTNESSLRDIFEDRFGLRVLLENDTRARCYAEYTCGKSKNESDVLYLHLGRGVAIGIVVDGKLYYGKSGFAGEFGHIPFFDNEIICSCGKKGCLETEVSGIAIEEKILTQIENGVNTILRDKYDRKEGIHIDDIIAAAKNDDTLSIELIEEAGEKVGKAIAFLINTFNPETVIVGGNLAAAGDYILLPLKSATNKYSLSLVYKDTTFRLSKMTENANALGVAMLIRNKVIGL
ncbi:MAG: ROK family protein [Alistipes sp.]